MDEMEHLVGRFDCERTQSRNQSVLEADAEKSFEDLYKVCHFAHKHMLIKHLPYLLMGNAVSKPDRILCIKLFIGDPHIPSVLVTSC